MTLFINESVHFISFIFVEILRVFVTLITIDSTAANVHSDTDTAFKQES